MKSIATGLMYWRGWLPDYRLGTHLEVPFRGPKICWLKRWVIHLPFVWRKCPKTSPYRLTLKSKGKPLPVVMSAGGSGESIVLLTERYRIHRWIFELIRVSYSFKRQKHPCPCITRMYSWAGRFLINFQQICYDCCQHGYRFVW